MVGVVETIEWSKPRIVRQGRMFGFGCTYPIVRKRYFDIKPAESAEDYQIRKWLSQVPHGGIVDNMAVLICYNEKHPSQSLVIVEDIKNL